MTEQSEQREKFLSDQDLAAQTLGVLRQFDADIQAARLERTGEGKNDADQMPGHDMTYGERIADLEKRQAAIVADNADTMDEVRALRDEAREAQRVQREVAKQQATAAREAAASGQTAAPPASPLPQVP